MKRHNFAPHTLDIKVKTSCKCKVILSQIPSSPTNHTTYTNYFSQKKLQPLPSSKIYGVFIEIHYKKMRSRKVFLKFCISHYM